MSVRILNGLQIGKARLPVDRTLDFEDDSIERMLLESGQAREPEARELKKIFTITAKHIAEGYDPDPVGSHASGTAFS